MRKAPAKQRFANSKDSNVASTSSKNQQSRTTVPFITIEKSNELSRFEPTTTPPFSRLTFSTNTESPKRNDLVTLLTRSPLSSNDNDQLPPFRRTCRTRILVTRPG